MIKSKEEKKDDKPLTQEEINTSKKPDNNSSEIVEYSTESLMPELEELVKKNPNRLIGCGG